MAGGLGIQLLSLGEVYNTPKEHRPDFKDGTYYITWAVNIFFAWLIGCAYFSKQEATSTMLAIQIGASAPLIFKTISTSIPKSVKRDIENN